MSKEIIEAVDETKAPAEPAKASKPRVGGYRLLAILVLLLAVGGLFVGMVSKIPTIGKYLSFIGHVDHYQAGDQILKGSLLGYLVKYFMTADNFTRVFKAFSTSWGTAALYGVDVLVHAMVAVAVVAALVCFVLACIPTKTGKLTKNSAMWSAVLAFLGYFGLFAWNYYGTMLGGKFVAGAFDFPSIVITGLLAVLLILTAIFRAKGRGFMNIVLTLFTLAAIFALIYPGSLTTYYVYFCVDGIKGSLKAFMTLLFYSATLFLVVVLTFNWIASIVGLSSRKFGFKCFRYALLLLAVILFHVTFILANTSNRWQLFTTKTLTQLISTIGLLVAVVGAFVISLVCAILYGKKDKAAKAEEKEEKKSEKKAEEKPAEVKTEPVVRPLSAFERKMVELAAQSEKEPEEEEVEETTPVEFKPRRAVKPVEEEPEQSIYDFENCTYDAFISSLTNREKDEFGDVFIANKHGAISYLPVYVVGGDNSEFFRKAFIYLGRFRKNISASLLDKMYQQISQ